MTRPVRELVPAFIRNIEPYVPGKPIEDVERELGMHCVKLASNENPLGPSPRGIEAARKAVAEANRYPDGGGYYLRKKLSERLRVSLDQIILGAGSTDLIELAAKTLLHSDDSGITSHGSFPMYYIAIRATGARLIEVPQKGYLIDLDGIARAIEPRTKLIYLANPNNPTGTFFSADDFEQFLNKIQEDVLVVLDEAYFDYVERPNYSRSVDLVREGRNVLVLRTFSKVYGLAGLRIGYGVGPSELLEELNKLRLPFNTSIGAQAAALAALDDFEHVRRSVDSNRAGLAQLGKGLAELNLAFVPSVGNFVLVETGGDAEALAQELMKLGVIVRPMRWMGFPSAIRVTVGTAEENRIFLSALEKVRSVASAPQAGGSQAVG
jgi:histidinol-phosphate aminotransferase